MLTTAETAALRAKVAANSERDRRSGKSIQIVEHQDGPLDGMRITLDASDSLGSGFYGWVPIRRTG